MPFGLRNAAQTFQRFIVEVLHGLSYCYAYINDILVASANEEEHKVHLQEVFSIRSEMYSWKKRDTIFRIQSFYRQYKTTARESRDNQKLLEARDDKTVAKQFLGTINFYRRFIPGAARDQTELNEMLKGISKNEKEKSNGIDKKTGASIRELQEASNELLS